MRSPQLVVFGPDDWVANQLQPLAEEYRWLLRPARRLNVAADLADDDRVTLLLLQTDPRSEEVAPLELLADLTVRRPEVVSLVISDTKLSEGERAAWTATVMGLGARYVLFPPLTRAVLEDALVGFVEALSDSQAGHHA